MKIEHQQYEDYVSGSDNERWSQSYYYNFYDPKTKVGAFIRLGLSENLHEANTWFVVFQDGQPLFNRSNLNLPYTDDRPAGGIKIAGMHIESLVPLEKTRIRFESQGFQLDLMWDELLPMEDCIALSHDEDGSFAKELCNIHLEGISRVSGHIVSRDGRIDVDGSGFRDISAGPRNWDALSHYRLAWPVFENGMALSGIHGISTDNNSSYMKMFHDGNSWIAVKHIEDSQEVAEDGLTITRAHWRFTDALDREYEFTAEPLFRWFFPFDTFILCDQLMRFELSDGTVGYGLYENGYRLPWRGR